MSRVLPITLLAIAVFAVGMRWNTYAIGGSDSYCYAHQAEGWASGRLLVPEPLVQEAPWPYPEQTFAPAGHVASRRVAGAHVPMCPAGLSLIMAGFMKVGGPGAIFFVVPLFGALLVVATWAVGSRYGSRVGIAAAIATACSPAFLFQLVQPMSDVPAAALWISAIAVLTGAQRWSPAVAGLLAGAAILIRPNLLPIGLVLGVFVLLRRSQPPGQRLRHALLFAAGCAPGCLAVAAIQQFFYGSPLSSGYGNLDALFSTANIGPNAERYVTWLWETHTPLWLLAIAAMVALSGWLSTLLFSVFVVNLASYLPYVVFNDWWYLRFLLPSIPLLLVLSFATIDAAVARAAALSPHYRQFGVMMRNVVAVGVAVLIGVLYVDEARARSVFDLARLEARYARAGAYIAKRLPANAFVITGIESGSVRYYSGRRTLVWNTLDSSWLDGVVKFSREHGLEPYLLLERSEESMFRERFSPSRLAALDWPPIAEINSRVRIYRPDDRDRYYAGEKMATEYVR